MSGGLRLDSIFWGVYLVLGPDTERRQASIGLVFLGSHIDCQSLINDVCTRWMVGRVAMCFLLLFPLFLAYVLHLIASYPYGFS